jgi:hypothetical protein
VPKEGSILIDGAELRQIDPEAQTHVGREDAAPKSGIIDTPTLV